MQLPFPRAVAVVVPLLFFSGAMLSPFLAQQRDAFAPVPPHVTAESMRSKSPLFASLSHEEQNAFLTLANAGIVLFHAPFGKTARGDGERAFQLLFQHPKKVQIFAEIARYGTTEGAIYGLCGLFLCSDSEYQKAKKTFLANHKGRVSVQRVDSGGLDSIDSAIALVERQGLPSELLNAK
jgi:hypothetical protein